ncbi:MAG: bifunctional UDP-N-acetylglucosamine diphosphorylase/glucosamine-1-phosphate N-acetyltransferase GlmU [bacterium]
MTKIAALILAAGKGTRMKSASDRPKVLFEVAGAPMVQYPLEVALAVGCKPITLVVGHGVEAVKDRLRSFKKLSYALQKQQLGSAHAVMAAEGAFKGFRGDILILSGDVPLIGEETVRALLHFHRSQKNVFTLTSFRTPTPTGYGRVIRNIRGEVLKVVEETDVSESERKIDEVNAGLYVAQAPALFEALKRIKKNPVKNEYYFTDLPGLLHEQGRAVGAFAIPDASELMGVNTRFELAQAEAVMQERIQKAWMLSGVSITAPHRTWIQKDVTIGPDTEIQPDVALLGKTQIGEGCVIEQGAIVRDGVLKARVVLKAYSHVEKAVIESQAVVGPFARIRPDSHLLEKSHVGNFVELKKTVLGEGSKANHLSYLGDAKIGKGANIGAGTITCNYDGVNKYLTQIGDGVFVGSDTQLVAPVKVGKNAYIGAGTTVTKEVPAEALAVSRTEQKNISGYAKWKKKKK